MPPALDSWQRFRAEIHFDDVFRGSRELRLYTDPVEVIEVTERAALLPALSRLDELIAAGYHAAGYLSFEAGYTLLEQTIWPGKFAQASANFDASGAIVPRAPEQLKTPLLSMGIFRGYQKPRVSQETNHFKKYAVTPLRPGIGFEEYRKQALLIHEEILSGRTYQVNYTFFLDFFIRGDYKALFHEQGTMSRYGAMIESPGARVISFSPELFFQKEGERVVMKPMKGTAPRGATPEEDRELIESLKKSAKERAENSMIVDLIRNDLGRISRPGTVRAFDVCHVETYPTLHQMTSTIEARLLSDMGYCDLFSRLFPSGSVTGAPKLEAMKKIAALESRPRGVYTGAVGFIDPCGESIFNVAIRTVELPGLAMLSGTGLISGLAEAGDLPEVEESLSERAHLGIGSGFVYDSVIDKEYDEALLKSKFLRSSRDSFELIEGLLLNRGVCYQVGAHLDRLEKSAHYFDYPFERAKAETLLHELALKHPVGRYKVRLVLNEMGGFSAAVEAAPRDKSVLRLAVSKTLVDHRSVFCRHKTTWRTHLDLAWKEAKEAGYDEVIFCNDRGEVTETAIHNIFALLDKEWVTPPVSSGLLPGVMRNEVLRRLPGAKEGLLTLDDLKRAERVVLVNSIRGVRNAVLGSEVM